LPGGLFGSINSITTSQIDNFLFGGNRARPITTGDNLVSKYVSPNDISQTVNGLGDGDADVTEEFNDILVSTYTADDFATVPPGGENVVNENSPSQNAIRGKAYSEMEPAVIGAGEKSRNDVMGGRSFINPYAIIHHASCNTANDFLDIEGREGAYPKNKGGESRRELSLDGLLKDFPSTGSKPERYSTQPQKQIQKPAADMHQAQVAHAPQHLAHRLHAVRPETAQLLGHVIGGPALPVDGRQDLRVPAQAPTAGVLLRRHGGFSSCSRAPAMAAWGGG
jgi:hypothetical protein